MPESSAEATFRRRYLAVAAAIITAVVSGVWFSGYAFLSADYLAWAYPFRHYQEYLQQGDFVKNHGLQDAVLVYFTNFSFLHQQLQTGVLPLWNPLEGLGMPCAALHGNGFLFPLHWVSYGLFAPLVAWHLELVAVSMLNVYSSFELFRKLVGSGRAAAFGSAAWSFGGWSAAYFIMPTYAWCLALFPTALWGVERYRDGRPGAATHLGLCVGGLLLVGHLQVTVPALGCVLIYALWRGETDRWRLLGVLAAGTFLASPHLVPLAELLSLSERAPQTIELALSGLMIPREYLCSVFPTLLGKPSDNFYFGAFLASPTINGREHGVFVGVVTVGLALLGVFRTRSRAYRVIGIAVAAGFFLAGAPWLYGSLCRLAPALLFLTPTRFLPFLLFGVCLLACVGWASLEQVPLRKAEARALLGALLSASALALYFLLPAMSFSAGFQGWLYEMAKRNIAVKPPTFEGDFAGLFLSRVLDHFSLSEPTIACSFLIVAACSLLCWKGVGKPARFVLVFPWLLLDLAVYFSVMNTPVSQTMVMPDLPDVSLLSRSSTLDQRAAPGRVLALGQGPEANLWLPYGISNLEAYESVNPGDFKAVFQALNGGALLPHQSSLNVGKDKLSDGTLDILGVATLYNRSDNWDERYGQAQFSAGVAGVYRADPLRGYVIEKYRVANRADSLEAMMQGSFDPRQELLVEKPPSFPSSANARFRQVETSDYGPNRIRLEVEQERPGMLVLTDLDYPGWEARVNARPTSIIKAHGFARAIELTPGLNRIELIFRPTGFLVTLALALAGLLVLVATDITRFKLRKPHLAPLEAS